MFKSVYCVYYSTNWTQVKRLIHNLPINSVTKLRAHIKKETQKALRALKKLWKYCWVLVRYVDYSSVAEGRAIAGRAL